MPLWGLGINGSHSRDAIGTVGHGENSPLPAPLRQSRRGVLAWISSRRDNLSSSRIEKKYGSLIMAGMASRTLPIVTSARLSPTELRNPRSMKFDETRLGKAIELM